MNVGKAIYYLLANNANVSAITTRIYPEVAPQDAALPFVVYRVTSVSPDDTHDGPAVIDEVRVDIICISDSYDEAADLSSKSRVALDRVYGTYNTVNVESIQFDNVSIYVRDNPRQYGQESTFIVRVKRDDVQIATGSPIEDVTLGRLADVSTDGATDDQVLTYDAATDSWGPEDASTVASLGDLTDVTLGTPANNQVLLYNEAGPYWQNAGLALKQLSNVTSELDDAIDRQALVYDEATSQWIHDGVGQVVIPVRNPSRDDSIAVGTVLKATGAQGDRILVAPFEPTDDPKLLIGIASEVLGNTTETKDGHAQVYGELRNISTNTFQVGDILYASAGGALTTTVGDYPIAIVLRAQENTGRIFIRMWKQDGSRYNDQAETLRAEMESSFASADVELLFTAQADGYGVAYSPESDSVVNNTPAEDYQVERAIYYNNTGLASYVSDTGWSTLETNVENYAAAKARVEDYIRGGTYGKLPCTFAIVRTEELIPATLLGLYPGAAAAYSLRLIGDDYTGSAVRVRRASDNAEQDIGFNIDGDLDTSALATFCSGTDGFVKVWYDQSGNSNDATQATTTAQPKIYDSSTGVVTENGKPALDFDGSNDTFSIADFAYTNSELGIYYVTAFNNASDQVVFSHYVTTVDQRSWILRINNAYWNAVSDDGTQFFIGSGGTVQTNTLHVWEYKGSESGFDRTKVYVNGSAISLSKGGGTGTEPYSSLHNSTGDLYIGSNAASGLYLGGRAQEIIMWTATQSASRTGIETNINDYYSIYTP